MRYSDRFIVGLTLLVSALLASACEPPMRLNIDLNPVAYTPAPVGGVPGTGPSPVSVARPPPPFEGEPTPMVVPAYTAPVYGRANRGASASRGVGANRGVSN
ncbi:MAG: hypothetical protein WCK65_14560 [Rhodospirillaceae bacterium]